MAGILMVQNSTPHQFPRGFATRILLAREIPPSKQASLFLNLSAGGEVMAWLPHSSACTCSYPIGLFYQLRANVVLFKSCSSLRLFLSLFVWPRSFWKSSCVLTTNSLISIKSFSHCVKWSSIAFLSSSTVFKSFSGSFPPSNFFTASMNSRDLLLSNGAGFFVPLAADPGFFLTGIWEVTSLELFLLLMEGLPFGLDSLDVGAEGSLRDCEKKLIVTGHHVWFASPKKLSLIRIFREREAVLVQ